ncbi:DAK2 domain-containing protein [Streptomyces sp. NPDC060194]|uniref:DAK2 domain-containing protein n=1 Tax=Streptomyces sp. NPDC060194 TaxID=3347069 RepID=UPI0036581FD5
MAQSLDALAVRTWCARALEALGKARQEIDAINVYPVADGDTGTNLYLTVESAAQAVEAAFEAHPQGDPGPTVSEAFGAMAHGALIGARGNSGTILAQLLRGMAEVLGGDLPRGDGNHLATALHRAAESAYLAVARPVEGTVLTVATAAAEAALRAAGELAAAPDPGTLDPEAARPAVDCAAVAGAALAGAAEALAATPDQLAVLGREGVVDAGGQGLVTLLGALVETLTGAAPQPAVRPLACPVHTVRTPQDRADHESAGPAFEVIYLLESDDDSVTRLRTRLDVLGDSLVVVGGDGLWNVHVHVDDAGAAVEAGIEAGRPYRIRITHFGAEDVHSGGRAGDGERDGRDAPERARRAVVAVVPGDGLALLCRDAGATTVLARPGEPPASGELVEAIRQAHAHEVVLLPNAAELRHTAAAAADQARAEGVRVALIPTRAAVQGLAALAVHEPDRRFDEDVVAMTSAAGATRYAELAVAESEFWTMAGICQAGDVLGMIDGDVAVIGDDLTRTAAEVLDRMLHAGGELVTLVLGEETPQALAEHLERRVRTHHLAVDTVVYRGGRHSSPLLIGVE